MKLKLVLDCHVFMNTILFFFFWIIKDSLEIQNVKLILPSVVQAGSTATLLCLYDLEGASLYSVQWYRGKFEFFRFIPNENPPDKVFQIPGLYVDTFASNENQVTLRNIPSQISGEFSCEITTDAPRFSTSCVSENLTVVDFNLSLEVGKRQFFWGDVILANCTLIPRLPSTRLIFHWNSKPISSEFIRNDWVDSVQLCVNTTVFNTGQKSTVFVQLRCSAVFNEMNYLEGKEVTLQLKPSHRAIASRATQIGTPYFILFLSALQIFVKFPK